MRADGSASLRNPPPPNCPETATQSRLVAEGVRSRVVNMASFRLFERQDAAYRESVLPAAGRLTAWPSRRPPASAGTAGSAPRARSSPSTASAPRRRRARSSSASASRPTTSTIAPGRSSPPRPHRWRRARSGTRGGRAGLTRGRRDRRFFWVAADGSGYLAFRERHRQAEGRRSRGARRRGRPPRRAGSRAGLP